MLTAKRNVSVLSRSENAAATNFNGEVFNRMFAKRSILCKIGIE